MALACLLLSIFNIKQHSDHLRNTFHSKCILPLLCILSLHPFFLIFNPNLQSIHIPYMFQVLIQEKPCNHIVSFLLVRGAIFLQLILQVRIWCVLYLEKLNAESWTKLYFKKRALILLFHIWFLEVLIIWTLCSIYFTCILSHMHFLQNSIIEWMRCTQMKS